MRTQRRFGVSVSNVANKITVNATNFTGMTVFLDSWSGFSLQLLEAQILRPVGPETPRTGD